MVKTNYQVNKAVWRQVHLALELRLAFGAQGGRIHVMGNDFGHFKGKFKFQEIYWLALFTLIFFLLVFDA